MLVFLQILHRVDREQNGKAHEVDLMGFADWRRGWDAPHDLLRDRHVQIQFTVVRGRLQASVLSCSEEGCIFCQRP